MYNDILNDFSETQQPETSMAIAPFVTVNIPGLAPGEKHSTVFKYFDDLVPGGFFEIINDHDPKPLYYQMLAEKGSIFTWEYLQKGPEIWKVLIKRNKKTAGETVGEMAANDLRKADVFKKLGIDFCCGGKKTLQQACNEKGLAITDVENALNKVTGTASINLNFNQWKPGFLADYIYNQHHQYYYTEEPIISDLMNKVFDRHGKTHPEYAQLHTKYFNLKNELDAHFKKEEVVVFPFIKVLENAKNTKTELPVQPSLIEPIQLMESEHEEAGDLLREINKLTNNYTAKEDACNSIKLLYKKLSDLEQDLHMHIHLENNVLFPKGLAIEKELNGYKSLQDQPA